MSPARLHPRFWAFLGTGLLVAGMGVSCSAARSTGTFTNGNGGSSGTDASGNGAGSGTGMGGDVTFTTSNGNGTQSTGTALDPDAGCAGTSLKAQELPLDIYVMLDQSGSMSDSVSNGGTKWDSVTAALTSFLQQPGLAGISVGINYFGVPPGGGAQMCSAVPFCAVDTDCGSPGCGPCMLIGPFGVCAGAAAGDSCNAADYAKPEVEIAPLPAVGPAIISSMGKHMPSTNTPTAPALQGAIDHAKTWAAAHPDHVVVAVLATDGQPSECSPTDAAGLAAMAAQGLSGTPSVKTFTIGIFAPADIPAGPDLMDAIAAAGGTTKAFNINTQTNVNQAFLDALNQIRGASLGCNYTIPAPQNGTPDYTAVNVQYTPGGGGTPEIIPQVQDKAHCPTTGDAWFYDNPAAPKQIVVCDATCNKLGMDSKGEIDVVLGCKTVVK